MIDSRDAAGADRSRSGLLEPGRHVARTPSSRAPTGATIQIGIFDEDIRLPGLSVEGCGVIKGVWFKPPGTPVDCVFKVGANDAARLRRARAAPAARRSR